MANNIRDLTDATGRRMADALEHLSGSGKSKAEYPHLNLCDLMTICNYATDHGHFSNQEIKLDATAQAIGSNPYTNTALAGSPVHAFLIGLEHLSDFDIGDDGRIAFVTYNYMRLLMMEATRYNLNGILKFTDGLLTQISKCPVVEVSNEHLPSGSAFLILSGKATKALIELEAQGLLYDTDALHNILLANADGIYFHGNQPLLKNLDVAVTPSGSRLNIVFGEPREKDTNNFYILTKKEASELPAPPVFGTTVDVTGGAYSGSYQLAGASDDPDAKKFQYVCTDDMTCAIIFETLRSMKPVGYRIVEFSFIS